jgi:hypothetical protein
LWCPGWFLIMNGIQLRETIIKYQNEREFCFSILL